MNRSADFPKRPIYFCIFFHFAYSFAVAFVFPFMGIYNSSTMIK